MKGGLTAPQIFFTFGHQKRITHVTVMKVLKKQPLGGEARYQGPGIVPHKLMVVVGGDQRSERMAIITGGQRSKRASVIMGGLRWYLTAILPRALSTELVRDTCPSSLPESVHLPSGLSLKTPPKQLSLTLLMVRSCYMLSQQALLFLCRGLPNCNRNNLRD